MSIATEAIDRLHTTAESHNRVMVVEVMGRHAGWIAVMSGIAGGADVILIPEQPVDYDDVAERSANAMRAARTSRSSSSSEGCELPGFEDTATPISSGTSRSAHRGVGEVLGREIEERTGFETRVILDRADPAAGTGVAVVAGVHRFQAAGADGLGGRVGVPVPAADAALQRRHRDPEFRITPDYNAKKQDTDTWQDGVNGGLLGITDLLLRAHVMSTYLSHDWGRDWGSLRKFDTIADAHPAQLDLGTATRTGWWSPGPIRIKP